MEIEPEYGAADMMDELAEKLNERGERDGAAPQGDAIQALLTKDSESKPSMDDEFKDLTKEQVIEAKFYKWHQVYAPLESNRVIPEWSSMTDDEKSQMIAYFVGMGWGDLVSDCVSCDPVRTAKIAKEAAGRSTLAIQEYTMLYDTPPLLPGTMRIFGKTVGEPFEYKTSAGSLEKVDAFAPKEGQTFMEVEDKKFDSKKAEEYLKALKGQKGPENAEDDDSSFGAYGFLKRLRGLLSLPGRGDTLVVSDEGGEGGSGGAAASDGSGGVAVSGGNVAVGGDGGGVAVSGGNVAVGGDGGSASASAAGGGAAAATASAGGGASAAPPPRPPPEPPSPPPPPPPPSLPPRVSPTDVTILVALFVLCAAIVPCIYCMNRCCALNITCETVFA